MCMGVLAAQSAGLWTMCMPGACRDQEGVSDSLTLELQMVVSYQVGSGNQQSMFLTSAISLAPFLCSMTQSVGFGLIFKKIYLIN